MVNIRCVVLGQKVKAADWQPIIFIAHKIVVTLNYLAISKFAATAKATIKPSQAEPLFTLHCEELSDVAILRTVMHY